MRLAFSQQPPLQYLIGISFFQPVSQSETREITTQQGKDTKNKWELSELGSATEGGSEVVTAAAACQGLYQVHKHVGDHQEHAAQPEN